MLSEDVPMNSVAVLNPVMDVNIMLESIREQMQRYKDHNMEPRFVLMNVDDYHAMVESASLMPQNRYNSDKDTVNGLPIVICERIGQPQVTTSPSQLLERGLL